MSVPHVPGGRSSTQSSGSLHSARLPVLPGTPPGAGGAPVGTARSVPAACASPGPRRLQPRLPQSPCPKLPPREPGPVPLTYGPRRWPRAAAAAAAAAAARAPARPWPLAGGSLPALGCCPSPLLPLWHPLLAAQGLRGLRPRCLYTRRRTQTSPRIAKGSKGSGSRFVCVSMLDPWDPGEGPSGSVGAQTQ